MLSVPFCDPTPQPVIDFGLDRRDNGMRIPPRDPLVIAHEEVWTIDVVAQVVILVVICAGLKD